MKYYLTTHVEKGLNETIRDIVKVSPSVSIHRYDKDRLIIGGKADAMFSLLMVMADKLEDIKHPWSYSMPNRRIIELDFTNEKDWIKKLKEDTKLVSIEILDIEEMPNHNFSVKLRGYERNLIKYLRYYYGIDEEEVQYFISTIKEA